MKIIDIKDYVIGSQTEGRTLGPFDFSLSRGDVCLLSTESMGDALAFLKALATLIRPLQGRYRFNGELLNLWDHDNLLSVKKKIGYITSHAALISNSTILDNLLWIGAYHHNTLSVKPDQRTQELCDLFSMHEMMDRRPSELSARDCHLVITIRELAKSPEVLLLENPEDFIGLANFGIFWDLFAKLIDEQLPVVFLSNSKSFIQSFSNRKLMIMQGKLTETQTPE